MKNLLLAFPGRLEIDRQQAAVQQIDMAIEMFHRRQWACAITLALAAETQLPTPPKWSVTSKLQLEYGREFIDKLNEPRNWLKHPRDPDTVTLYEMDAVMGLLRAISSPAPKTSAALTGRCMSPQSCARTSVASRNAPRSR